jgi:hypothetical protein
MEICHWPFDLQVNVRDMCKYWPFYLVDVRDMCKHWPPDLVDVRDMCGPLARANMKNVTPLAIHIFFKKYTQNQAVMQSYVNANVKTL